MLSLGTFLIYMFQLAVGPTPTDAKQFALLKGEWRIERVVSEGVDLPESEWKGKKVVFAAADSKQKDKSAAYAGRLRTKGNMAWIETKTVTYFTTTTPASTASSDEEYSCAYQVDGKKMKLLMNKVSSPSDRGPRPITETKEDRGILFYLKRK